MFGSNFKACREMLGISQIDVAEKTGLAQPTIARYEKNDSIPSVEVAHRLANALGVSLDLIMQESVTEKEVALMAVLAHIAANIKSKGLTLGKIESLKVISNIIDQGI